jgi:hypothetical protein
MEEVEAVARESHFDDQVQITEAVLQNLPIYMMIALKKTD